MTAAEIDRFEIAAPLASAAGAHVRLGSTATAMEHYTYLAVLDALRIPRGVAA